MKERILQSKDLAGFQEYLLQEEKSAATIEKYVRDAAAFFRFIDGKEVTKERTVAYKAFLQEQGYAVRSINSMLASVNTGLTEENVIALALAKRIAQTYIPSCEDEGSGTPINSYMPPADAAQTYSHFVEKTGLLRFFLPSDKNAWGEYYKDSRFYDEAALELLTHFPDCVNDLMSAMLQDWSITANHKAICTDYPQKNTAPNHEEFVNEYKMASSKGYVFTPIREYLDYKIAKVSSSIRQYLSRKYDTDGKK